MVKSIMIYSGRLVSCTKIAGMSSVFRVKSSRSRQKSGQLTTSTVVSDMSEKRSLKAAIISWFRDNPQLVRKIVYFFLGLIVLLIIWLLLHTASSESHNKKFYTLVEKFDDVKKFPKGEARSLKMKEFAQSAESLCHVVYTTADSYAGCVLLASALIEAKEYEKAANVLKKTADYYEKGGLGAFTLFYAGYAWENAGELDKAMEIYVKLEKILKNSEKDDVALYHQGRIHYYNGKYDEADALFTKIVNEKSKSVYKESAKKYLLLVAAGRSGKVTKN